MKNFVRMFSVGGVALMLSACGISIPQCVDELDNCSRGGPYTEERTARAGTRLMVKEPEPILEPMLEPVIEPESMPEPAPIVDTQVMTSAEPQFKQISK